MTQLTELPAGAIFQGRYRVVRCIKAGGMGAVYECEHLSTQKRRALKVMLPEIVATKGMRERFELESRITAKIESDHIVETFDSGVDAETGAPFLVMELLRGEDLERSMEVHGAFVPPDAVVLLAQLALALDRTHAAGIVHRDLKPQNLFLTQRDDGSPRVKILDFGIAKVVADRNRTAQQTAAIGTPLYMSPEQTTGDGTIGPRADLYALGHIAYALLVGRAYWSEEQEALAIYAFLSRVIAGPAEPAGARAARFQRSLPPAFDAWFARATASSPAHRFERASTQIAELANALGLPTPRELLGAPSAMSHRLSSPTSQSRPPAGSHPHATPISRPITVTSTMLSTVTGPRTGGTMGVVFADPVAPPRRSRSAVVIAMALGAVTLTGAAVMAARTFVSAPRSAAAEPVRISAAATIPAPDAAPAAAPLGSASGVLAPTPSASASASTPPAATTGAAAKAVEKKPAPKPARVAPPSCDPPFTIDAKGHHHPKDACF